MWVVSGWEGGSCRKLNVWFKWRSDQLPKVIFLNPDGDGQTQQLWETYCGNVEITKNHFLPAFLRLPSFRQNNCIFTTGTTRNWIWSEIEQRGNRLARIHTRENLTLKPVSHQTDARPDDVCTRASLLPHQAKTLRLDATSCVFGVKAHIDRHVSVFTCACTSSILRFKTLEIVFRRACIFDTRVCWSENALNP